jgi:hypothetical protein
VKRNSDLAQSRKRRKERQEKLFIVSRTRDDTAALRPNPETAFAFLCALGVLCGFARESF